MKRQTVLLLSALLLLLGIVHLAVREAKCTAPGGCVPTFCGHEDECSWPCTHCSIPWGEVVGVCS